MPAAAVVSCAGARFQPEPIDFVWFSLAVARTLEEAGRGWERPRTNETVALRRKARVRPD
jgi:hypothetical protein